MFFCQNFGERFQEREKTKQNKKNKKERTADCKVLEVTALNQDTESSALKTVKKHQFTGCSGMASLALVELMPITQRKINCTE